MNDDSLDTIDSEKYHVCAHPLVVHKLTHLRQDRTIVSSRDYARLMRELGMLMAYEATSKLPLEVMPISAEPGRPAGRRVPQSKEPVIVPTVRSGLVMAEGMREIIPSPFMGHIGVHWDPVTKKPLEFMVTMPEDIDERMFLIVDPFVDSGETACAAIRIVCDFGIRHDQIQFVTLVISKRGFQRIRTDDEAKNVVFHCARIDGYTDADEWFPDFQDMNLRLYRTANRKSIT